jgi:hypothetical protein
MEVPVEKTVTLTPNWEGTARWFAHAFVTHSFDRGAKAPICSFIDQIRYLTQTDPDAVQRLIDEFSDPKVETDAE